VAVLFAFKFNGGLSIHICAGQTCLASWWKSS